MVIGTYIYYVCKKKKVASTVLFTRIVSGMTFITYGQATALLTLVTLFLGELLPKALGVSKAETVSSNTFKY
jgi:Mg2+/Co2+ transporter CorB